MLFCPVIDTNMRILITYSKLYTPTVKYSVVVNNFQPCISSVQPPHRTDLN